MKAGRPLTVFWIMLVVGLVSSSVGCSKDAETQPVALVLVDVSMSSNNPEIRERYLQHTQRIVDGLSSGGRILVDVIDDNPRAHSTLPINEELSGCDNFQENRLACGKRIEEQHETILSGTTELLNQASQGTDIFGALDNAQRILENYPEGEQKYLVLFSDMMQSAQDIHFRRMDLENAAIADLLEQAPSPPDLDGVQIYIAGAGSVNNDRFSPKEVQKVEEFWLAYFEQTGAQLPKARYGSAFVRFP